ncbi:MAG: hypothetical protein ABMB14_13315, partial [Myxococcota bacterium]
MRSGASLASLLLVAGCWYQTKEQIVVIDDREPLTGAVEPVDEGETVTGTATKPDDDGCDRGPLTAPVADGPDDDGDGLSNAFEDEHQ